MGRYTDEDGVDGPFERAMRAAERDDRREAKAKAALQRALAESGYTVGAVGGAAAPQPCPFCGSRLLGLATTPLAVVCQGCNARISWSGCPDSRELWKRWNEWRSAPVPGSLDTHRFITDQCRANHGDEGAAKQVVESAHRSVATLLDVWPRGSGARIHVAVTVEPPKAAEERRDG